MKLKLALSAVAGLVCVFACLAAPKPNFSGVWVLDKNKSFSNPPGLDQTMTIEHVCDQI